MNNRVGVGIVFGCFVATLHVVWGLLLLLGWAQPLVNFIFWVHMLSVPVQVQPFNWGIALLLIAVTWCVGFVFGFILATIWNTIECKRCGSESGNNMH